MSEFCQFFRNSQAMPPAGNGRRLDRFCSDLGLGRERAKAWCLIDAVLDATWGSEYGNCWAYTVAYAEDTETF